MGWSGWDHDRVMLSTVRLTWCMMDTVDGAVREARGQGSGVTVREARGQESKQARGDAAYLPWAAVGAMPRSTAPGEAAVAVTYLGETFWLHSLT